MSRGRAGRASPRGEPARRAPSAAASRFQERVRRVAIVCHPNRAEMTRRIRPLVAALTRRRIESSLLSSNGKGKLADRLQDARPDLVVSVGGDGTILAAARATLDGAWPLLPVNLGGLGFLASAEGDQLEEAVEAAIQGRCVIETRALVDAVVQSGSGTSRPLGVGLNDAVLRQGASLRALRLELDLDGRTLGLLLADGLVIATPTGSTAYSLSAGGPVVLDEVPALVATPVCAHTLASRPLVFSGTRRLTARILGPDEGASLSLDGQPGITLRAGDAVSFSLAKERVRLLRLPGHDSLRALREKLGWQGTTLRRSL